MNRFIQWYHTNYNQITWFLIGFLVMSGIVDFGEEDYTGAVISFGIAYINYLFVKR